MCNLSTDLINGPQSTSGSSSSVLTGQQELSNISSTHIDTSNQHSQTQNECIISSLFEYTGMTYYEGKNGYWIVRFAVVKDLDALITVCYYLKYTCVLEYFLFQYLKKEYQHVDRDDHINFSFVDETNGYIELHFDEQPPPGWKIIPMVEPCKVCVCMLLVIRLEQYHF